MSCNPVSNYPDSIDPLIFFQDVSLEKLEIMRMYNELVTQNKYSEATEFINDQNICGYFADYFNAIENRIYNLQNYILTKKPKQPFVSSDNEPTVNNEVIWI